MKQVAQGTNYVPSFRTGMNVNTLQERYFRELKKTALSTPHQTPITSLLSPVFV